VAKTYLKVKKLMQWFVEVELKLSLVKFSICCFVFCFSTHQNARHDCLCHIWCCRM